MREKQKENKTSKCPSKYSPFSNHSGMLKTRLTLNAFSCPEEAYTRRGMLECVVKKKKKPRGKQKNYCLIRTHARMRVGQE